MEESDITLIDMSAEHRLWLRNSVHHWDEAPRQTKQEPSHRTLFDTSAKRLLLIHRMPPEIGHVRILTCLDD